MTPLRSLLLIALTVVCSVPVFSQWNTNTYVNLEISGLPIADMVSVPTSDGKTWIAFYHENTGNYDMRAQLIDADGFKLLGPNGVLVSNQPSGTSTWVFNACVDGSNNLIIGCQDLRSDSVQAVVYKISEAGNHLWSSNGVVLGAGMVPYPAALSSGDIAVTWNDDASNTLKIQKITSSGTLAWSTPVTVMVGSSTTTRGQIVANTGDKFTIVYQKYTGLISTNLYAQMFNSSGTALYSPLQISTQTTAPYRYYSIAAEADTTYFGYYASPGMRFNSFVQRINPNGSIPWGINGSNFNTSTGGSDNYQMETSIALKPGSPYVWAVSSFCDPNQTNYGIYMQKYLKTSGARQFTDQGKVVYSIGPSRYIQAGNLALVDDTPIFMFYVENYKIYATRLDTSGNFVWPGNHVEISSTTAGGGNPKGRYGFTPVGPYRCAGVWTENRGSSEMGYAQGITVGGLIGIDVTTAGGVPAVINTGAGTLQCVATIYPLTASQNVTWSIVPVTGTATISNSGLVTALTDGTAWAKATVVQDPTMKDSILITMSNQVPVLATVVTLAATDLAFYSATLHGSVNANYYNSTVSFQWGTTTSYGNTIAATPSQASGNTSVPVLAGLTGLIPGTTFHFRCVATNLAGTAYGQDLTFTTQCMMAGTMSAIAGPAIVCAGSGSHVYSVDPFPGATSYIWSLPTGAAITSGNNTNSITVSYSTSATSGEMSVYASDGTCFSLPSPAYTITVIPLPVQAGAISGVQEVCEGATGISYSIVPIPGVSTYVWTIPSGAVIASGQGTNSITVNYPTGSLSGNISVYGTNNCGTGQSSPLLPVTIIPAPAAPATISGPVHICKEASGIIYSVPPVTNAYGYVWSVPAGVVITAGANSNQVTVHFTSAAVSGTIAVYGTNGNCAGQSSPPLYVSVFPAPPTPVITQHGDTLISSADEGNQWYKDGTAINGATGKKYLVQAAGNYSVVVTLNECSSLPSASIYVLPVSTGDRTRSGDMVLYPNPGSGLFNLILDTHSAGKLKVDVYESAGNIVWSKEFMPSGTSAVIPLDLSALSPGVYQLVLTEDKAARSYSKLVINR